MDHTLRKNPSRTECEKTIRRILITEILQNGKNKHFRMATDFITYGTLQDAVNLPLTVHTKPFLFAPVPANQYGGFLVAEQDGQILLQLP